MDTKAKKEQEKYERCLKDIEALVFYSGVVFQKLERDLQRRDGFSASQTYLLSLLETHGRAGCRMGEISRRMNLEKSSVTRLVEPLINAGYLEKQLDPTDKRAWRVMLTDLGQVITEQLGKSRRKFYGRLIEKLPKGHVREVMDGFGMLVKALDR